VAKRLAEDTLFERLDVDSDIGQLGHSYSRWHGGADHAISLWSANDWGFTEAGRQPL
jgi:hypothetical protein